MNQKSMHMRVFASTSASSFSQARSRLYAEYLIRRRQSPAFGHQLICFSIDRFLTGVACPECSLNHEAEAFSPAWDSPVE